MVTIKEFISELENQYKNLLHITWEFPGQNKKNGWLLVSFQNINLKTLEDILKKLREWFKFTRDKVHIRAYEGKQLHDNLFSSNEELTEEDKKHFKWVTSIEDEDPEKFEIEREKINREGYRRKIDIPNVIICLIEFEKMVFSKN